MSMNGRYAEHKAVDITYWRELGVRIDALNELTPVKRRLQLQSSLELFKQDELEELIGVLALPKLNSDTDQKAILHHVVTSLSDEQVTLVSNLRDFLARKKKVVGKYYRECVSDQISQRHWLNCGSCSKRNHLICSRFTHTIYGEIKGQGTCLPLIKKCRQRKRKGL